MFADLHLVCGFVQLFEVTAGFAVIIGVITQAPVGIEVEVVAKATIHAELEAVKADRIPEGSDPGLQKKARPSEG